MNWGCWSIVIAKRFDKWYPSSPLRIITLERRCLIRWIVQYVSIHDHDVTSEAHNLNVTTTSGEMEKFVLVVFSIACICKSKRKYLCAVYFYMYMSTLYVCIAVTICLCAFYGVSFVFCFQYNEINKHLNDTRVVASTVHNDSTYTMWYLTWHDDPLNDDQTDIVHTSTRFLPALFTI